MTLLSPDHVKAKSVLPGDTRSALRWVSASGDQVADLSGQLWPALRDLLNDCAGQAERDAVLAGVVEICPTDEKQGNKTLPPP